MGKKLYSLLLCIFFSISTVFAQNITVKGTVTSAEDGLPVVGASVFVQGTKNGTVTDNSGQYALRDVPSGSTLVFSCIGMLDVKKTADRWSMLFYQLTINSLTKSSSRLKVLPESRKPSAIPLRQ